MNVKKEFLPARNRRESRMDSYGFYHNIYDEVKEKVSTTEAARHYGFEPNRAGYICCPFHGDRTPSLKLYEDGFYCFGCGAGGSVIDFVGKLFHLDPFSTVMRINQDFYLGLPIGRPPTAAEREAARLRRRTNEAKKLFVEWRDQMLLQINAAIRTANTADPENVTESEAMAIRYRETLEFWGDQLSDGSVAEQMEIFRNREEVERLCRTILSNMPTKSQAA